MKKLLVLIFLCISINANADTWQQGRVIELRIWDSDKMYVKLDLMPSVSVCSRTDFFIIDSNAALHLRERFYATLLTAQASNSNVGILFDETGGQCEVNRPIIKGIYLSD